MNLSASLPSFEGRWIHGNFRRNSIRIFHGWLSLSQIGEADRKRCVRTRGATHKFIARKRNDLATRGEESGMAITIRHQPTEKALFNVDRARTDHHPLLRGVA